MALQRQSGAPRCPLLLAALAYALGILAGQRFWRPALWWLVAAVAFAIAAAVFLAKARAGGGCHRQVRSRVAFGCVLTGIAAVGALAWSAAAAGKPAHAEWQSLTDGREVTITGYVVHDGLLRGAGAQRRQSVDVHVEGVEREIGPTALELPLVRAQRKRLAKKRRDDNCVGNSIYSADLLRAAGVPVCTPGATADDSEQRDDSKESEANISRESVQVEGVVRLSIYAREVLDAADDEEGVLPQVFTYGQRVKFTARLRPPRNFGNPGALDFAGYLERQGIYALGSVRADRIEQVLGSGGSRFGLWRSRARRSLLAKAHRLWRPEQAGLLDAMLIGERSFIGRDINTAFQRTGIYHILVVSGMNVGILAFVVFWLLKRFRCGELTATVLTILLSCGYAYLAELGAPIVRSVVMLTAFLCARLLYRDRALLNSVGAGALVLLAVDPQSITEASFQLTFLSVLAIGGIAVPLIERTSHPYRVALRWLESTSFDLGLEPRLAQFRLDLRLIAGRFALVLPRRPRKFRGVPNRVLRLRIVLRAMAGVLGFVASAYELVVVSMTTQVALALPMAWYFHRATVVGLPANLVAVPLTGVLMPASVAAVALAYVWMPLARLPALITSWALSGITRTVDLLGGLRAAEVRLAQPELTPMVAAAGAFALALLVLRGRRMLAVAAVVSLIASAVWVAAAPAPPQIRPGVLEITGIDVGQAESFLVITPAGKTVLVDAGGPLGPWQSEFDYGEQVVAPYLWSRGINRLDAVVITHAHSDHYGGMPSVVRIFQPREMWVGRNAPDRAYDGLIRQAREDGVEIKERKAGERFEFGGAEFRVLAPPPGWQPGPKPKNNDSLVLHVAYGRTSALLEADAEKKAEEYMATENPSADLLKVAHNGSKTSSTPEFLAAVRPKYALIAVGARNSFGHPRREVIERLRAMHARVFRTDMLGAVTFLLDGERVKPMVRNEEIR